MSRGESITELRKAVAEGNLTLYVGAGVSAGTGLPTWEKLVLGMYFSAIAAQEMDGWRPFPNYLYAISEWHLRRNSEPLEITARRLKRDYSTPAEFLKHLHHAIYEPFYDGNEGVFFPPDEMMLRDGNATLRHVARLCEAKGASDGWATRSVITYNYDDLLERVLHGRDHTSVWQPQALQENRLPIYHVHGFVPVTEDGTPQEGSSPEQIVFTEDEYHRTAQDVYSWSNLTQIQAMSRSVGLMIGLSVSDRNMRRLLDAISDAPVRAKNFAILQKRKWKQAEDSDLDEIHQHAIEYLSRFQSGGIKRAHLWGEDVMYAPGRKSARPRSGGTKTGPRYRQEIQGILREVEHKDRAGYEYVLGQLGVTPIWYENHDEIGGIVDEILA